ncbi:MAG: hypothetical protein DMG57_25880 [Acidobacteria bacterium]|nr:MAG: hypothetical protein DMG57_25880 [Acidobacteriota bacterium]
MLQGSFVPPMEIRRLRDLTRMRASLRQDHARVANRIQKILEDANIKLGSVASDVLGVSGRHMLKSMLAGEQDPHQLAQLARGRLGEKLETLQLALEGSFTDHHRFPWRQLLEGLEFIEGQVGQSSCGNRPPARSGAGQPTFATGRSDADTAESSPSAC